MYRPFRHFLRYVIFYAKERIWCCLIRIFGSILCFYFLYFSVSGFTAFTACAIALSLVVNISIYSFFDKVTDLDSCNISVLVPTGSYEDWDCMLHVQGIKEKGERQRRCLD